MGTIYKLNFSNQEFYIGKTSLKLSGRIGHHTRNKGKGSPLLEAAFQTSEYLGYEVIEDNVPEDILGATEAFYIKKLKPTLNTLPGGETLQGLNHPRSKYSEEDLRKVANLLVTTAKPYIDIAEETGVLLGTVRDIVYERTHAWLIQEITSEALERARASRVKTYTLYDPNNEPHVFTDRQWFETYHGFEIAPLLASITGCNQKGWSVKPKEIFTIKSKELTITDTYWNLRNMLIKLGYSATNISAIFNRPFRSKEFRLVQAK